MAFDTVSWGLEQQVAVEACVLHIKCNVELPTDEWLMMDEVVNIFHYLASSE